MSQQIAVVRQHDITCGFCSKVIFSGPVTDLVEDAVVIADRWEAHKRLCPNRPPNFQEEAQPQ